MTPTSTRRPHRTGVGHPMREPALRRQVQNMFPETPLHHRLGPGARRSFCRLTNCGLLIYAVLRSGLTWGSQNLEGLLIRSELGSPASFRWLQEKGLFDVFIGDVQKGETRLRGIVTRGSTPVMPVAGLPKARSKYCTAHRPRAAPSRCRVATLGSLFRSPSPSRVSSRLGEGQRFPIPKP